MSPLQNILPVILGFILGLIWILFKLGWLEWNKINDKYGIIIPSLVTIALPFIAVLILVRYIVFGFEAGGRWQEAGVRCTS